MIGGSVADPIDKYTIQKRLFNRLSKWYYLNVKEKAITPENLIVVNPDEPSFETLHFCIYMSELFDEMEEGSKTTKSEQEKKESKA